MKLWRTIHDLDHHMHHKEIKWALEISNDPSNQSYFLPLSCLYNICSCGKTAGLLPGFLPYMPLFSSPKTFCFFILIKFPLSHSTAPFYICQWHGAQSLAFSNSYPSLPMELVDTHSQISWHSVPTKQSLSSTLETPWSPSRVLSHLYFDVGCMHSRPEENLDHEFACKSIYVFL